MIFHRDFPSNLIKISLGKSALKHVTFTKCHGVIRDELNFDNHRILEFIAVSWFLVELNIFLLLLHSVHFLIYSVYYNQSNVIFYLTHFRGKNGQNPHMYCNQL